MMDGWIVSTNVLLMGIFVSNVNFCFEEISLLPSLCNEIFTSCFDLLVICGLVVQHSRFLEKQSYMMFQLDS